MEIYIWSLVQGSQANERYQNARLQTKLVLGLNSNYETLDLKMKKN